MKAGDTVRILAASKARHEENMSEHDYRKLIGCVGELAQVCSTTGSRDSGVPIALIVLEDAEGDLFHAMLPQSDLEIFKAA